MVILPLPRVSKIYHILGPLNIHFPLANGYPGTICLAAALAAVDPHAPVRRRYFPRLQRRSSSGSLAMFAAMRRHNGTWKKMGRGSAVCAAEPWDFIQVKSIRARSPDNGSAGASGLPLRR